MTNRYLGLNYGVIIPTACSVINAIADGPIQTGSSVILTSPGTLENLPRVNTTSVQNTRLYGIVVGGQNKGIYNDGSTSTDTKHLAASKAGQSVQVCTIGFCLARVRASGILIQQALGQSSTEGVIDDVGIIPASTPVVGIVLNAVGSGNLIDVVPVFIVRMADE